MSITGSSLPLRRKQRISNHLTERVSLSEFVSCNNEQSSSDPDDNISGQSARSFISTQPVLKSPRHPSQILSDELNFAAQSNRSHRPAKIQDNRSAPAPRPHINLPASPNEVKHVNGVAKHDDRVQGTKKRGIVVIHPRTFFRDCFVRCLDLSYRSHEIVAFANIFTWRTSQAEAAIHPSIIVFFVDSGDASSVTDLQFLESVATDIPVVIVSDIDDVNYVVRALKGGARGYIPTSLSFNVAIEAVRLVEAGGTFVPVSSLAMDRSKQEATAKTGDLLTERQMMVVEALCQGMANKQIAYELGMSEHTVKVHLRHIMRKLRARNRTEVAVLTKDFFERPHEQKRLNTEDGPH